MTCHSLQLYAMSLAVDNQTEKVSEFSFSLSLSAHETATHQSCLLSIRRNNTLKKHTALILITWIRCISWRNCIWPKIAWTKELLCESVYYHVFYSPRPLTFFLCHSYFRLRSALVRVCTSKLQQLLGDFLLKKGDFREALDHYTTAVKWARVSLYSLYSLNIGFGMTSHKRECLCLTVTIWCPIPMVVN